MRRVGLFVVLLAGGVGAQTLQTPATPASVPGQTMSAARAEAFAQAAAARLPFLPGEVVVKFKNGMSTASQSRAMSTIAGRGTSTETLEWAGSRAVMRDRTQDPRAMAATLAAQPEVEYAEPNYLYKAGPGPKMTRAALSDRDALLQPRTTTPNDQYFASNQWNFAALNMTSAWDLAPGGSSSLVVAVIDTGITNYTGNLTFKNWNGSAIVNQSFAFATNPDLAASRLVSPYDFLTGGTTIIDTEGHGTHVSGTIGEDTNNSIGAAGMAYNVKIMPLKVCASFWDVQWAYSAAGQTGRVSLDSGGCPNSAIAAAITYAADNGAKVINMSLGGESSSAAIRSAITYAVGKGAFVAAAGGNEYLTGNPVEYPAGDAPSIDGFMSVAATNHSGNRASYSNTGSYIEIAAPGGDTTDVAQGTPYIWQSTLLFTDQDPTLVGYSPRFDRYALIGYTGTSMATPHVTGLAALMMSRGITAPQAVEAVIKATAKDLGASGKDTSFGYGLIQPRPALFGQGAIK